VAGGRYLNPANAVTGSRYLALPVFAWAAARGEWQVALAALLFSSFLDLFDGAVARKFNCASSFGEMFDAVTDAICFGFFLVVLTYHGRLPLVPVLGFLVLGGLNALFRLIYARRAGRTVNYRSYAMERTVAYTAYLGALGVVGIQPAYYAYSALGLMAVVLAHDSKRMLIDPVPPAEGVA
jgi:phosphatidylglycerophosphate synthase